MALVWTPEPSSPLYTGSETLAQPLTFTISVSDDPEAPSGASLTITEVIIPPNIPDITYTGIGTSSIELTVAGFGDLFPIEIKTVDFETQQVTTKKDFIVQQGSKIFSYKKDVNSPRTLNIRVVAASETAEYTMVVDADYSSNLPAFLQSVQESY
jgi:hypothetical protein